MTRATSVASSAPGEESSSKRSPALSRLRFASYVATRNESAGVSWRTGASEPESSGPVVCSASAPNAFCCPSEIALVPKCRQYDCSGSSWPTSATATAFEDAKLSARQPSPAATSADFRTRKLERDFCITVSLDMKRMDQKLDVTS